MYDVVKLLHVAAAIVWVGGGTMLYMVGRRLMAVNAGPGIGAVAAQNPFFGTRVFMPASIVSLLTGLYLVSESGFAYEDIWVSAGLLAIAVSIALGAGVLGPGGKKLMPLMAERGPADAEVIQLQKRLARASGTIVIFTWAVVVLMVLKP